MKSRDLANIPIFQWHVCDMSFLDRFLTTKSAYLTGSTKTNYYTITWMIKLLLSWECLYNLSRLDNQPIVAVMTIINLNCSHTVGRSTDLSQTKRAWSYRLTSNNRSTQHLRTTRWHHRFSAPCHNARLMEQLLKFHRSLMESFFRKWNYFAAGQESLENELLLLLHSLRRLDITRESPGNSPAPVSLDGGNPISSEKERCCTLPFRFNMWSPREHKTNSFN